MAINSTAFSSQPLIPQFNGDRFDFWSVKMKTLFLSQELWDLVEIGYKDPDDEQKLKDNKKRMQRLCSSFNKQSVMLSFLEFRQELLQRKHCRLSKQSSKAHQRQRFRSGGRPKAAKTMAEETDDCQLSIRIIEKLDEQTSRLSNRNIFEVPENLRRVNEKAYEPYILAIGPYHRGKDYLIAMEEHKKRYLKELLQRIGQNDVKMYVTAMRKLEVRTRQCYADSLAEKIKTDEFVEMMLLDGCFIIELLRRYTGLARRPAGSNVDEEGDPCISLGWMTKKLGRDLLLVENQLPYFVLENFFEMTKTPIEKERQDNLQHMILYFFATSLLLKGCPGHKEPVENSTKDSEHEHLLSLLHDNLNCSKVNKGNNISPTKNYIRYRSWVYTTYQRNNSVGENSSWFRRWPHEIYRCFKRFPNENYWRFMRCATELKEAGIKFKRVEGKGLFDIKFKNGIMTIPRFEITGETESIFRNLIVYEQFSPSKKINDAKSVVSDYMKFMDCLINSQKDVELLCKRNILHNCLGDDETAASMFNKLGDFATFSSDNYYLGIFRSVNEYCGKKRHVWIASLRQKYFNTPWAFISFFAAVLLLLLTFLQTVFSAYSLS